MTNATDHSETRSCPPACDVSLDGSIVRVSVGGDWSVAVPIPSAGQAERWLAEPGTTGLVLAAHDLGRWDTSLVALLAPLVGQARSRDIPLTCEDGLPEGVTNLVNLALAVPPRADPDRHGKSENVLARLGGSVVAIPGKVRDVVGFIGDIAISFGRLLCGRAECSSGDVWLCIQESGAGALPIVSLISLLVGLILAFVGVVQLRMFGAEIYVSSLVVIGMTRIMGAIMTGIVMAGRTGASYAAIIGSMQVNEEVDALTALGISPSDYLVLPRVIALATMTPLLVLYADFMGILGGFVVGSLILGIDPLEYLTFTQDALQLSNIIVGVVHGFAFGLVVAVAGCYQGLRCGRSAEAVGGATTAAVVNAIIFIILVTAVLTVVFNAAGL